MEFDTKEGRPYLIRFNYSPSIPNPAYDLLLITENLQMNIYFGSIDQELTTECKQSSKFLSFKSLTTKVPDYSQDLGKEGYTIS